MAESGRRQNQLVVFVQAKVSTDGPQARAAARQVLAESFNWAQPHLQPLGIADEAQALYRQHGPQEAAQRMPNEWVEALSVSGTPEQALAAVERLAEAGADSIILQPLKGDLSCLDEYIQLLMPALQR
jgi:alkanesulfonate monooxygenase SsuD/methylene tetrahydromethanopterin reductase-like flavin-dependent oxidoreductase (luciferase family)